MSTQTAFGWNIDDWLSGLGLDPDTDSMYSWVDETEHGYWLLEVRIPDGCDTDEYLCALEAAWQERFGDEPVEFKAYRTAEMVIGNVNLSALKDALSAAFDSALTDGRFSVSSKPLTAASYWTAATAVRRPKLLEASATDIPALVPPSLLWAADVASVKATKADEVPKHLLNAKGPRGKWGQAKGHRTR